MDVICIKNLVKKYGDFVAVDNLSLNIEKGKIYGFLGVNGAGKSTTINMICGLLNPTDGEVRVFSENIHDKKCSVKRYIGLVPQNIAVYYHYTVIENVKFFGSLYGIKGKFLNDKVNEVLEFVGLSEVKNKLAKELSGGMIRRLNIACAIVHNPKLLILDEPTLGIDPKSRRQILNTVKELNKRGTTVLYTTHYMDEVEKICDEIVIIDNGKVLVQGTKDELKDLVSDIRVLELEINDVSLISVEDIKKVRGVMEVNIYNNKLVINSNKDINNLDKIISYLGCNNVKINDISYKNITLEDVFLRITGKSLKKENSIELI